jgi:hypothetical protein
VRFAAAAALAFVPIFLANLIFADRFRSVGSSTIAFGANLLGSMAGGLLEFSSLVVGYRSLLAIVAVLYGVAFLVRSRIVAAETDGSRGPRERADTGLIREPVRTGADVPVRVG